MKTYTVCISFRNGSRKMLDVTQEQAKQYGNINNWLFRIYPQSSVSRILVFCKSPVNKANGSTRMYADMTYHWQFEYWLKERCRIERENKPGYEDFTGYGNRTDGKRNRFTLGHSTGWLSIYLEILTSRSSGGAALSWNSGTFRRIS